MACRGVTADLRSGKLHAGGPFVHKFAGDEDAILGLAIFYVEILDVESVSAGNSIETKRCRAALWREAFDRFATGSVFPGGYVYGRIACELHGFGFDAIGVVTDAALLVGDSR